MRRPTYADLAHSGELERRAAGAFELLGPHCVVCPRGCKVICLKAMSAPEIRVTPNHSVFASHRDAPGRILKVAARELTGDHCFAVPKRSVGGQRAAGARGVLTWPGAPRATDTLR